MLITLLAVAFILQAPEKTSLPGAKNVIRVDAAVLCGGATTDEALPALKKQGFASVINLRQPNEPGVDIAASRAAAQAAGLKYIHIPVSGSDPQPSSVQDFLQAVQDRSNQPVYIHCASANRVGAMWLIKRVVLDGWDVQRAADEATAIGLTSAPLRQFAIDYATKHKN